MIVSCQPTFAVTRKDLAHGRHWYHYYSWVTYLVCILEKTMSGESMAHKIISKVNARLKFLHQKNKYLTPNQFDYAWPASYPNLSKKLKNSSVLSTVR